MAGGQFMRAVVERCQHTGPKVHTLVTLGGQHQGVMNVPKCWNPSFNVTPSYMCSLSQRFLGWGASLPLIRTHLVQAQYFKVQPLLCTAWEAPCEDLPQVMCTLSPCCPGRELSTGVSYTFCTALSSW